MRRLEIRIDDKDYEALEELKRATGAATLAEMLRDAVTTYRWIAEKVQQGYTILAENAEDRRTVEPILPLALGRPS